MTKVVIFDWGGVFMRTEDYTPRHNWDNRLGKPFGTVESIVHGIPEWRSAQLGEISTQAYWMAVQGKLSLTLEETHQLAREFYKGDSLDLALVNFIKELRAEGIPVGLMSNNIPELQKELQDLNLIQHFTEVVLSANIGIMKPDPGAYEAILRKLNATSHQAIFIDDSLENIEGAEAIGMKGIHFSPEINLVQMIRDWLDE